MKHYREMMWYCKVNFKTNPSRLKTKKMNLAYILSSALIVREKIKLTIIIVHSVNIALTKNSIIIKNLKIFS